MAGCIMFAGEHLERNEAKGKQTMSKKRLVELKKINGNPWQTRAGLDPEYVAELADDIRRNGLMQAPAGIICVGEKAVNPDTCEDLDGLLAREDTVVVLAFGHNRLAAFRKLAETDPAYQVMPVELRVLSDEQMAVQAWAENAARKNLTPIEEATAIQRDMNAFGWTQEQVGEKLGMARATVANKLRLLKLPANVQAAVAEGKVSERQASALLPLMEIPEEARKYADAHMESYETKPKDLIKSFGNGTAISSDDVRGLVARIETNATVGLGGCKFLDFHFEGIEGIAILSAECANCVWRAKNKDTDRCRRPDCYEVKRNAWATLQGAAASKACGLEVLPGVANYREFSRFYDNLPFEIEAAKEIYTGQGCENLRIEASIGGYHPNGVKDYALVCYHGPDHECTCKAKILKRLIKNDPVKAQKKENERLVKELEEQAAGLLADEMLRGNVHAWRAYARSLYFDEGDRKFMATATAEAIAARIVRSTAGSWTGWQMKADPEGAKAALKEGLAKAGLQDPWTEYETPVEKNWSKFMRIRQWMNSLANAQPKREAIEGNISNLYELLNTDGFDEIQNGAIRISIQLLEKIGPEASMIQSKEQFGAVEKLVNRSYNDPAFEAALSEANEWVLRYALALVPADQGQKIALIKGKIPKKRKTLAEIFADEEAGFNSV